MLLISARSAQTETHNAILACTWAFPDGYTVSKEAMDFVSSLLRVEPGKRLSAANALTHPFMRAVTGDSPQAILTEDRRPVKALLGEFNMQRSVAKLVKGAHRRLGLDDRKEGSSSSVTH